MNCYKVVTFSLQLVTCMSLLSVGSDTSYVALYGVTANVSLCHNVTADMSVTAGVLCHEVVSLVS